MLHWDTPIGVEAVSDEGAMAGARRSFDTKQHYVSRSAEALL